MMTKTQKTIKELCEASMEQLYKKLSVAYPAHHWNHIKVWEAYWHLKDVLKQ